MRRKKERKKEDRIDHPSVCIFNADRLCIWLSEFEYKAFVKGYKTRHSIGQQNFKEIQMA